MPAGVTLALQVSAPLPDCCLAVSSPAPPLCSCMATSGDGYVVVGADDGKVRGQQGMAAERLSAWWPDVGWQALRLGQACC